MYHCFSLNNVLARKSHRCIWCGEEILPKEYYLREKSVYDGRFQNHKWHLECYEDCVDLDCEEFNAFENERPERVDQEGF